MNLPIDTLKKLDDFVSELDDTFLTARQEAIKEAARLLIYLTHDEFYNTNDISSTDYLDIAEKCSDFVHSW